MLLQLLYVMQQFQQHRDELILQDVHAALLRCF
jgi:hypothetical protein